MRSIKGPPPGIPNKHGARRLERSSDRLKRAGKALDKSSRRDGDAFAEVDEAGVDALSTTGRVIEGIAGLPKASGLGGWQTGEVAEGGRYVSKGVAHGLSELTSSMSHALGGGQVTTVRELVSDPSAVMFTEKVLGRGARALQRSVEAMTVSWGSYTEAVSRLAAIDAKPAAAHVAAVADGVAKAAALTTSSSVVKMSEYGVKLAATALDAAEHGEGHAPELTRLAARFVAATAAVLASPDTGQLKAVVTQQLGAFQHELESLTA